MATHNMINNGTFRNILEHDPIGKEAFLVNVLYLKKKTGINYSWIGLLAQMQTLSFTYTHLLWVHEPWAHEIISPEGHGCYCAKKKKNGGVGKRIWKPFSKLSPYKTDNISLNSQRFPCLIFLWSCCRLVQGRYTSVCLTGETFCSLYNIPSDLL